MSLSTVAINFIKGGKNLSFILLYEYTFIMCWKFRWKYFINLYLTPCILYLTYTRVYFVYNVLILFILLLGSGCIIFVFNCELRFILDLIAVSYLFLFQRKISYKLCKIIWGENRDPLFSQIPPYDKIKTCKTSICKMDKWGATIYF